MALKETSVVSDRYAIYNADCMEVLKKIRANSIHLSIYSPPFGGLYNYSSSDRDLSNCKSYEDFFDHYSFIVEQMARVTMPGRLSCVHVMDVATGDHLRDFPGDVIKLHERHGFVYHDRKCIWKEPLRVAIRTRSKALMHKQLVEDSSLCRSALADYVLVFRKKGTNPVPVSHPTCLMEYSGSAEIPPELLKHKGNAEQKKNRMSQWIWRRYASAFWYDIRIDRVLPYREGRDPDDEKHVHPLQLDVIDRCLQLWSNPSETVLTPFMGVGSEVFGAVCAGRRGIGAELKASYFRQAIRNLAHAVENNGVPKGQVEMFDDQTDPTEDGESVSASWGLIGDWPEKDEFVEVEPDV